MEPNVRPVQLGFPRTRVDAEVGDRPDVPELVDRFGRVARDLRVSVTEKCSLRCTYCMPEEGLPPISRDRLLSANEIARLVRVGVHKLGIREVRFTGGEPLMRRDLEGIISHCAREVPGIPLAMTTNAVGLEHRVHSLVDAGLTRVNISLDTIDRDHFAKLTRRDRLSSVLAGVRAAARAGLAPLKVNAVLMPETLNGAVDLLSWCLDEGVHLRFIEQMPLDADHAWARSAMVDAQRLIEVLGERFMLTEVGRKDRSAPAEEWLVDGGPATVGVIATVTRNFCAECDRTRLTAEGTVRSCLFSDDEIDLRDAMRSGASDGDLATLWRGAMWSKSAGHGINSASFAPPLRSMGAIGG
ncbi:GTP 3',8-cyclase MoaA [Rhodococcus pyridinivorans]|uniref:GTP 3',8-cyclase MoaA n=1 Tax=Rhodococcus pyridinivorans TaxID=103816 RepID=UPI0020C739A0|nr:GTP 3',8-cyclase MoaA [Rhodococcus pyridinivorans]UTM38012.1 GTP 3',8-cyclase MoaA [Rhodococcus pyridinivorans]